MLIKAARLQLDCKPGNCKIQWGVALRAINIECSLVLAECLTDCRKSVNVRQMYGGLMGKREAVGQAESSRSCSTTHIHRPLGNSINYNRKSI
jgi:hypothetical protein